MLGQELYRDEFLISPEAITVPWQQLSRTRIRSRPMKKHRYSPVELDECNGLSDHEVASFFNSRIMGLSAINFGVLNQAALAVILSLRKFESIYTVKSAGCLTESDIPWHKGDIAAVGMIGGDMIIPNDAESSIYCTIELTRIAPGSTLTYRSCDDTVHEFTRNTNGWSHRLLPV